LTSLVFFSTVHIVGSWTSKLPSISQKDHLPSEPVLSTTTTTTTSSYTQAFYAYISPEGFYTTNTFTPETFYTRQLWRRKPIATHVLYTTSFLHRTGRTFTRP